MTTTTHTAKFAAHLAAIADSKATDVIFAAERCSRTPATIGQIITFIGEPSYDYGAYPYQGAERAREAINTLVERGELTIVGYRAGYALYSV